MIGRFQKEKLSGLSRAVRFKNGLAVLVITVCVSGTAMGFGPAFGSEVTKPPGSGADRQSIITGAGGITLASTPSPAMADPCLPLLKQVRHPSDSAIDRTRRPAGQQNVAPAVAIGYVLGLRHAPGPRERLKDDIGRKSSHPSIADGNAVTSHALAVSEYRRCRGALELSLLGEG